MKTDIQQRLKELRSIEGEDGVFSELDKLLMELRYEQHDAVPRPTCCQDIQDAPAIALHVDCTHGDSSTKDAVWRLGMSSDVFNEMDYKSLSNPPAAKFCPFCGTALPKMVRKFTEDICRVTDGGYYCDTCKERLQNCLCLPPSAAFGPEE